MPNIRSAAKRVRADAKRRQRNQNFESELKSLTKKFHKLVKEGQKDQAKSLYPSIVKRLDQAATKKIIHKNTASRNKSRLARYVA